MRIMGIDPGRNKFGIAVVDENKNILYRTLVRFDRNRDGSGFEMAPPSILSNAFAGAFTQFRPDFIAIGDGTCYKQYSAALDSIMAAPEYSQIKIYPVNETKTTEEARSLYRKLNPPPFPLSLLPSTLIPVFCDVDDYAAAVIAIRLIDSGILTREGRA